MDLASAVFDSVEVYAKLATPDTLMVHFPSPPRPQLRITFGASRCSSPLHGRRIGVGDGRLGVPGAERREGSSLPMIPPMAS